MERHQPVTRTPAKKGTRHDREALWDWNLVSNRMHFSPGWISLAGCADHEISNTPDDWLQRVHPDDSPQLLRDIEAVRTGDHGEFEFRYRLRHKDGTYRWMSSRGATVRNEAGEATRLTGTQSDITAETVTDRLTGLPNQLLLMDRLRQSIARASRHSTFHFALLLVDVGRRDGTSSSGMDSLLTGAARRLERLLRSPETRPDLRQHDLVARMEGNRLAIVLDGLSELSQAKNVGDCILAAMSDSFTVSGREVRVSPTIGIAVSATGYTRADEVVRDAGTALHRAQVMGGPHCELFDIEVLKSEQAALQLEGDLQLALQRNELELFYQPIVSTASGAVAGFEALVRWRHAVLGLVSPPEFIPLAERNGLIVPLGRWVIQEACAQLRAWHNTLPLAQDIWVSVNVSAGQLRDPQFLQDVEDALRQSDLQPRSLVLELTESTAMDNPAAVTTLLMRLRALGVRISIDDFGTGYSSLAYLRQFPVDALKIDQSFVRAIANDKDTAILAGMVAMARELGLNVVAEGVETEQQLTILQTLECASVQGYFFARPLDAAAAADFLQSGPALPAGADGAAPVAAAGASWVSLSPHLLTLSRVGRGVVMAVAVLTVVGSAGALALYGDAQAPAPPPPPVVHMPLPQAAMQADLELPDSVPAPIVADASVRAAASVPVAPAAKPLKESPAEPAAPAQTSFALVHLHRIGKCRGQLLVTRTGVTFVPDDKDRDDAFSLKHSEFLQTLEGKTLTIRSTSRTFRFTVQAERPDEAEPQLARVADAIVKSRGTATVRHETPSRPQPAK